MGRHRRSDAGRAATGRDTGAAHTQSTYAHGWADGAHPADPAGNGTGHDAHDQGWDAPRPSPYGGTDPGYGHDGGTGAYGAYPGGHPSSGIAPYLDPEAQARSQAYLFGTDGPAADRFTDTAAGRAADETAVAADGAFTPSAGTRRGAAHRRRKKKAATPVKTGLLGVSAAVALGSVAVATGVVPGLENYRLGGGDSDRVQASDTATNSPAEFGGTSGDAAGGGEDYAGRTGGDGAPSPSGSASPSPSPSTKAPEDKEKDKGEEKESEKAEEKQSAAAESAESSARSSSSPSRTATKAPAKTQAPSAVSAEAQAAAEVLRLVNEERSKVGCGPLAANSALADLASNFSTSMAAQGFFDHTDPSGRTPWDRAEAAGITNLGGENIARGQATAAAVMDAWMNSEGHRANILNCDFKTLGVGVHFGDGGPWWTQNFGY